MKKRMCIINPIYSAIYRKFGDLPNEYIFDTVMIKLKDKLNSEIWYHIRGELFDDIMFKERNLK